MNLGKCPSCVAQRLDRLLLNSDNCVQVVSTGQRGCCPIGKTCVGGGGGGGGGSSCVTPSYSPCPNDNFCCRMFAFADSNIHWRDLISVCAAPGNICYRDSSGGQRCRSPSSPSVSIPTTTSPGKSETLLIGKSSHHVHRPTGTTFQTTSTPVFTTGTAIGTGLSPTVYPSPFPFSGTSNVVVYATDTRIVWAGSSWILGPSSCNSTTQSKKTSSLGHSLTFTVSSGILASLSHRCAFFLPFTHSEIRLPQPVGPQRRI